MTGADRNPCLLLGSANRHKVREWRAMLDHLAVDLVDPVQLRLAEDAVEDGANAEENARIKARAYFEAARIPTFSLDAALRIEGLRDNQQPHVRVRRICRAGERTSDAEMVNHYRDLLRGLGGRATGEWTLGIALALARDQVHSQRLVHRSQFVATPSRVLVAGAALQSLQVHPASGRYFSEMTPAEHAVRLRERCRRIVSFVTRSLPGAAPVDGSGSIPYHAAERSGGDAGDDVAGSEGGRGGQRLPGAGAGARTGSR